MGYLLGIICFLNKNAVTVQSKYSTNFDEMNELWIPGPFLTLQWLSSATTFTTSGLLTGRFGHFFFWVPTAPSVSNICRMSYYITIVWIQINSFHWPLTCALLLFVATVSSQCTRKWVEKTLLEEKQGSFSVLQ